MKRSVMIISILLMAGVASYAQTPEPKKIELSISGSYQSSSSIAGASISVTYIVNAVAFGSSIFL